MVKTARLQTKSELSWVEESTGKISAIFDARRLRIRSSLHYTYSRDLIRRTRVMTLVPSAGPFVVVLVIPNLVCRQPSIDGLTSVSHIRERKRVGSGRGLRAGVGARSRRRAGLPAFLWRVHEVRLFILIMLLILFLVVIFLLILLFFGDLSWPCCYRSCLPFNRRLTGHYSPADVQVD